LASRAITEAVADAAVRFEGVTSVTVAGAVLGAGCWDELNN